MITAFNLIQCACRGRQAGLAKSAGSAETSKNTENTGTLDRFELPCPNLPKPAQTPHRASGARLVAGRGAPVAQHFRGNRGNRANLEKPYGMGIGEGACLVRGNRANLRKPTFARDSERRLPTEAQRAKAGRLPRATAGRPGNRLSEIAA